MHYSVIVNPVAGGGKTRQVWKQAAPLITSHGDDFTVMFTKRPGHATYLAGQLARRLRGQKQQVVLAIGGDGTLNQVLNGLMENGIPKIERVPLAYLPAGTGNDFARGFGLSQNPLEALEQVLSAKKAVRITIGEYNEAIKHEHCYFLNNIGIGFDAAIVSRTNASKSKKKLNRIKLGSFSYLANALAVLYNISSFPLSVDTGRFHDHYSQATIVISSNHPYIGGGYRIAPEVSVFDDNLELVVAERRNWLLTFWECLQLARGKLSQSRFAHVYRGQRLHYSTTSLEFGQYDGEEMGNRFVDLTVSLDHYPFWAIPHQ